VTITASPEERDRVQHLTLAFDDNLGYPDGLIGHLEHTVSTSCSEPVGVAMDSFHDLGAMIASFARGEAQLMFLPCGCLPAVTGPVAGIAQATTGPDRSTSLTSVLVVAAGVDADSVGAAAGLRFAAINEYCTTSYWGPQFLARQHGTTFDSLAHPVWVNGFDDLVDSLGDGRAEAAMVWLPYLERHADQAAHLRELGRLVDLPAPLLVGNLTLDPSIRGALDGSVPFEATGPSLFTGLASPDRQGIEEFSRHLRSVRPGITVAEVA